MRSRRRCGRFREGKMTLSEIGYYVALCLLIMAYAISLLATAGKDSDNSDNNE